MSLTSFLEQNADVRARCLDFKKPWFILRAQLLAPPLTENYSSAGTAFDYLLRFYLEKLNPNAMTSDWVACDGVERLAHISSGGFLARKAQQTLDEAVDLHRRFLRSRDERPGRELIKATIKMARLDAVYRAGLTDGLSAPIPKPLIDDLEAMLGLVKRQSFLAKKRCVLNPTFGIGSEIVLGADADLIIDDTLVDIKTTKHLKFERELFNQLIGYYALACIGGVDGCKRFSIRRVGIYYARYGVLHSIAIADCIRPSDFQGFLRWFADRAIREHLVVMLREGGGRVANRLSKLRKRLEEAGDRAGS
jgi:hypothetical protein